jgi:hypothetical protein
VVIDRTQSNRPAARRPRRFFDTPEARIVTIVAIIVSLLAIVIGGHIYGKYLANLDLNGRDAAMEQLRAEAQKLKRGLDEKTLQLTRTQAQLTTARAALEAVMPSANTYNIVPNQTLIVGDGHLTLGMVGSPSNESIVLDINGKQQPVTAGQTVNVSPDPSTTCQVGVQSFDMFKAVVTASCAKSK